MDQPCERRRVPRRSEQRRPAEHRRTKVAGYHGAYLLCRELDDEVEFATIMIFDSLDAVRTFAGEDYEAAHVPPRAREVLARFDDRSTHFETLLTPAQTR